MNKIKRTAIFETLRERMPAPDTELQYQTPFELLIAVILSAQATDISVNKATASLYPVARTPEDILELGVDGLKTYIRTIGLFNNKAENIIKTCRILVDEYDSEVPHTRKELEALPGVGRKTANVVLGVAFEIAEGIAVDTHVKRLSKRLGLTARNNSGKIERDLMELVPREDWIVFAHLLIFHGRRTCKARKPDCLRCVLDDRRRHSRRGAFRYYSGPGRGDPRRPRARHQR